MKKIIITIATIALISCASNNRKDSSCKITTITIHEDIRNGITYTATDTIITNNNHKKQ